MKLSIVTGNIIKDSIKRINYKERDGFFLTLRILDGKKWYSVKVFDKKVLEEIATSLGDGDLIYVFGEDGNDLDKEKNIYYPFINAKEVKILHKIEVKSDFNKDADLPGLDDKEVVIPF